jgi:hypothetical protein
MRRGQLDFLHSVLLGGTLGRWDDVQGSAADAGGGVPVSLYDPRSEPEQLSEAEWINAAEFLPDPFPVALLDDFRHCPQ